MKVYRKLFVCLLIGVFLLSAVGCTKSDDNPITTPTDNIVPDSGPTIEDGTGAGTNGTDTDDGTAGNGPDGLGDEDIGTGDAGGGDTGTDNTGTGDVGSLENDPTFYDNSDNVIYNAQEIIQAINFSE